MTTGLATASMCFRRRVMACTAVPADQRLRATSVNIARHTYYRDIMTRNGDAHKPVWISEAAWNATLDAELPRDQIDAFHAFWQYDARTSRALYAAAL